MTFLSPFLLWFLAAASLPVLIHLLNKRRHKTIPWAAMQFLLKATRESRGKKKLRHIIILTARALGIAALACAAARPFVSGFLGWGGQVDTVVLVLDRSASMELRAGNGLPPRRQQVLEKVRDAMKGLHGTRLVLVDSANAKPQEVPSPDVLAELADTAASDTAADLPSLVQTAIESLTETRGRSEIWLASDMQASNWRTDDERWGAVRASLAALPHPPALRVLAVSGDVRGNQSLRIVQTRRRGNELVLDLEVNRSEESSSAAALTLTLQIDGARSNETLNLTGQSLRFQKRIPLAPERASGFGWVALGADANPRDNAAFFAYGPGHPVKSLLVAPAGEAADYLALAAAPPGFGNQQLTRCEPAQVPTALTDDFSAVIWLAPLPISAPAEALQRFLAGGGQVLFFPPGTPSSSNESIFGQRWGELQASAPGKLFILKDWNQTDGPLRDGIDGTSIPGARLTAIRRQPILGDATQLARWDDESAFLTRIVIDRGTAWFAASLPDYTWSNLGDADVLLPLVQRIVSQGAERFDASYLAPVGSDAARLLPSEARKRLDDHATPDPANAAHEAGVYQLGERLIALNRPASEDDPEVASRESLEHALQGTGFTYFEHAGQTTGRSLGEEFWRPFLIAVLAMFILEAWLCLPKSTPATAMPSKA